MWKEKYQALYLRFFVSSSAQILDDHWSTFWLCRLACIEQPWWRKSGIKSSPRRYPTPSTEMKDRPSGNRIVHLFKLPPFRLLYVSFCVVNAWIKKWVSGRLLHASFMFVNLPPLPLLPFPPPSLRKDSLPLFMSHVFCYPLSQLRSLLPPALSSLCFLTSTDTPS